MLSQLLRENHESQSICWGYYGVSSNEHLTLDVLLEFPNKEWNWNKSISEHPNLCIEWILSFPEKAWNWDLISTNKNVTLNMLREFADKPWNWDKLSKNTNLSIKWLKEYPDKLWNWDALSSNPNITIEWLRTYPNKPWKWLYNFGDGSLYTGIAHNPNLTMEIIDEYADKFSSAYNIKYFKHKIVSKIIIKNSKENKNNSKNVMEIINKLQLNDNTPLNTNKYIWEDLSKNILLSIDILQTYSNKWKWGKGGISSNESLTCELLGLVWFKQLCWGKYGISSNPCITLEILTLYPHKPILWGIKGLSSNPSLTIDMLKQFPKKSWNWGRGGISSNPSLTIDILKQFPDKKWDYLEICKNDSLTIEIVNWLYSNEKKIYWGRIGISSNKNFNKNLTLKDINRMKKVALFWGFGGVSLYFGNNKIEEIKNKQKEYFHDYIFEELIAKSLHPDRIIKLIINGEFDEFENDD